MSSRGAYTRNGHVTTTEYKPKLDSDGKPLRVYDAVVLVGQDTRHHSLPDYAHTPGSKYIKEGPDGTFRELRDYDKRGKVFIEIGYHPENTLAPRGKKVLHYHTYGPNLERKMGGRISETENSEIYKRYKKYLEVYGL